MFGDGQHDKKNKAEYIPVPDVEKGTINKVEVVGGGGGNGDDGDGAIKKQQMDINKIIEKSKEKYPQLQLDDDQARLLGTLDEAIEHGQLDLALPKTISTTATTSSIEDWISQGKEFLIGLLLPTITAVVTFCFALFLEGQKRVDDTQQQTKQYIETATAKAEATTSSSSWVTVAVQLFPYINATIIFIATVRPLQKRFMIMIEPIFSTFSHAERTLQTTVEEMGPFVDKTIDGIQKDFHIVVEPIQPSLNEIESKAHLLEQVFDNRGNDSEARDLDIPDPSDIDKELDEAQGIVSKKLDEVKDQLQFEDYVPKHLRSQNHFYWRIIFPIIIMAWILQMIVAYVDHNSITTASTTSTTTTTAEASDDPSRRFLQQQLLLHMNIEEVNATNRLLKQGYSMSKFTSFDATSGGHHELLQKDTTTSATNSMNQYRDNMTSALNDQRVKVRDQYHDSMNQANETMHSLTKNVTNKIHDYEEDLKAHYHHYQGELNTAVAHSKSLVLDVLWSYLMAILQMLLVYIITSETVQNWVVDQAMKQVQSGAERTLENYGVTEAMGDVFGKRLKHVREQIMNLLHVYKKVELMLQKAGALTNVLPSGTTEQLEQTLSGQAVEDAMKEAKGKGSGFFRKLFNKKK